MEKMDYSPVIKALKKADQDFTEKNGVTHYSLFDAALEKAAETFNRENGTNFDPVEARHQYLELCEAEPNPFALEQVEVNVDDLVVSESSNRSIH
ncbi:hypothetical protein WE348_23235 (plasmid) [Alteromonas macleodii]|jgi:hypothetical protein|uniref:hypothetical protein n=1 Tax=Alteromonas macleodii TaxID=28108 RepID=UPI000ECDE0E6|nr:hypothetical protein [Pseudoalteromonas sp.]|tara:strand:+ start:6824 stop:7108 length:285 start_codon:yes stop_codon:yes gene_type:complete